MEYITLIRYKKDQYSTSSYLHDEVCSTPIRSDESLNYKQYTGYTAAPITRTCYSYILGFLAALPVFWLWGIWACTERHRVDWIDRCVVQPCNGPAIGTGTFFAFLRRVRRARRECCVCSMMILTFCAYCTVNLICFRSS